MEEFDQEARFGKKIQINQIELNKNILITGIEQRQNQRMSIVEDTITSVTVSKAIEMLSQEFHLEIDHS